MVRDDLEAHYRTLELPPTASASEVRRAYRLLSRVWHPDRFAADADLAARAGERQRELNVAYEGLLEAFRTGAAPLVPPTAPAHEVNHSDASLRDDPTARRPTFVEHTPRPARRPRAVAALLLALALVGVLWIVSDPGPRTVRIAGTALRSAGPLAIGPDLGCAADGVTVQCWGDGAALPRADSTAPGALRFEAPIRDLALGVDHACAVLQSGALECWGTNYAAQLGDGSLVDKAVPVRLRLTNVRGVSSLAQHSCAVDAKGDAYCWGSDADGQLGAGRPVAACRLDALRFFCSDRPERVAGNITWQAVAAGGSHSCGITSHGAVRCWGSNRRGQLGGTAPARCDGPGGAAPCARDPSDPVALPRRALQVVAGAAHTCALLEDGRAFCWGALPGSAGPVPEAPVPVTGGPFTALAAGGLQTCALGRDGAVACWGDDDDGSRGVACRGERCALRAATVIGRGARAVTAGFGRSCALLDDGRVRCWGRASSDGPASETAPVSTVSPLRRPPDFGGALRRVLIGPLETVR